MNVLNTSLPYLPSSQDFTESPHIWLIYSRPINLNVTFVRQTLPLLLFLMYARLQVDELLLVQPQHYGTFFLSLCVLVQLSLLSMSCLKHIYFHRNFTPGYSAAFSDIWRCYVSDLSLDLLQLGWIGCASHLLHLMLGTSLTSSLDEELDVKC